MNENIDIRMSNYLTILSNPMLKQQFDGKVIYAMEQALVIYTATTANKYVDDYRQTHEHEQQNQESNSILL